MTDLLAMHSRPPRTDYDHARSWNRRLCIGFLIDWLDSRPERAAADIRSLRRRARRKDPDVLMAAVITGRLKLRPRAYTAIVDRADYSVAFHAQIAGHLYADEVPLGEEVYRGLYQAAPDCMSALVNLAEIERRAGQVETARDLLQTALDRATSAKAQRHGIPDAAWEPEIRCAMARLAGELGDGASLLHDARRDRLSELVKQLERCASSTSGVLLIHQAFSAASIEQRIMLDVAARLARIQPALPPAAHGDFAALVAVEELIRRHDRSEPGDAEQSRYVFGPLVQTPSVPQRKSAWKRVRTWLIAFFVVLTACILRALLSH